MRTFVFITGLLLAFGGVGGVENSTTTLEMLQASGIAVLGLGLMATIVPSLDS